MFRARDLPATGDHHEQVFVERLGKVLMWARQIAAGDTSLAEDLAQDAFLHFTAGKPTLDEISNLDKYLYVVLKNLFRSHLASVSRQSTVPFDPLAHGNAMETWRSVNPERRLTLREELRRICVFVCERKESSKGASAFLLHFFHGLSLPQVAAVMQTTRGAVDERLSVVRKEARRWLERRAPALVRAASSEADLMTELRSIIAESCRGACFSPEEVRRRYASPYSEPPRDRLAHLASCSKCLSLVAQILQFPKDSGDPPAAEADPDRVSRWRHRRTEVLAMEPAELQLIVNGHLLASERVRNSDHEFSVSVALHEPLDFIEVRNGGGARVLFLPGILAPPEGKFDQSASIELAGRALQLNLRFTEPWPTVTICYESRTAAHEDVSPASVVLSTPEEKPRRRFPWRFPIPVLSTGMALLLIGALLFVQTRETALGAAELLNRAEKWQQRITTEQTPVLHRRFSLLRRTKSAATEHTFVEVWRRADRSVKLSRWTDGAGHVLGEARLELPVVARPDGHNIWQFEPSADSFVAAAGPVDHASVSVSRGHATIRTSLAELVLDRATNRPIAETLSLSGGEYIFDESLTETTSLAESPFARKNDPALPKENRRSRSLIDPPAANLDSILDVRELEARRILHKLQLAPSALVIRNSDAIEVQLAPVSAEEENRLANALGGITGLKVSFLNTATAVHNSVGMKHSSVASAPTAKLREPIATKWLKASLGSEADIHDEEERRLDAARRLVDLAAEWRLLAERYSVETESHLTAEGHAILNEIVEDIWRQIRKDADDQRRAIALLSPGSAEPMAERSCEAWQSQAARAADLIWENEQAIELFYASGTGPSGAEALSRVHTLSDQLDAALRPLCGGKF